MGAMSDCSIVQEQCSVAEGGVLIAVDCRRKQHKQGLTWALHMHYLLQ